MKPFFLEIFEYNHYMNQKLAEEFVKNEAHEKALRLFSHMLNAQHIWNARINNVKPERKVWDLVMSQDLKYLDRTNFEISGIIISNSDLSTEVSYSNSQGQAYRNSVRDILFHIVNHSSYHRGQIATAFKEAGIVPAVTDYIFYKR